MKVYGKRTAAPPARPRPLPPALPRPATVDCALRYCIYCIRLSRFPRRPPVTGRRRRRWWWGTGWKDSPVGRREGTGRARVNVRYGAPDPPGGVARCAAPVLITHGSLRSRDFNWHAYTRPTTPRRIAIIEPELKIHSRRYDGDGRCGGGGDDDATARGGSAALFRPSCRR